MNINYYLQLILTLGFLIAILIVGMNVVKFINKQRYTGDIKIIDRLVIDNNTTLVIVEINEKRYILGLSNKSIYTLDKIKHLKSELEETIIDYV